MTGYRFTVYIEADDVLEASDRLNAVEGVVETDFEDSYDD